MTTLSICIVNWNTRDFLRECLASIDAFPPACSAETIVVDNASSDGSAEMVRGEFPSVRLISNPSNVGYAKANNQALRSAAGDWLLLLNSDVRLLPGTLNSALETAAGLSNFGALGVRQVGSNGIVQRSVRSFPEPLGILWELLGLSKAFPQSKTFGSYRMTWFDYSGTIEADQPMATFLLTARDVYEEAGGLDENFPIFFNDVDWCFRIKEIGKKIYYTDRASIIHYGGASTGKAKRSAMTAESKLSLIRFYEKHYRNKLPKVVFNGVLNAVSLSLAFQRLRDLTPG